MDVTWEAILIGGLVPFKLSALCVGLGLGLGRRQSDLKRPQAGAALGAGLGFFAGYTLLSWTLLVPEESWHWLPYLALAAMFCGVVSPWLRWPFRAVLVLGLAGAAGYLLVPEFEDLAPQKLTWQLVTGGSIFGTWLITDGAMRLRPKAWWGLCGLLTLLAICLALTLLRIMMFVQLTGLVVAAFVVFALVEGKPSWRGVTYGTAPLFALTVPSMLLLGKLNSSNDLALQPFLWLLVAPMVFGLIQLLPERRWRTLLGYAALIGCLVCGLFLLWDGLGRPEFYPAVSN